MSKLHESDVFKEALRLHIALLEAPPSDKFAAAIRIHLLEIGDEIDSFVRSLSELHDLIDIRRAIYSAKLPNLVEWVESSIYQILHSRA